VIKRTIRALAPAVAPVVAVQTQGYVMAITNQVKRAGADMLSPVLTGGIIL